MLTDCYDVRKSAVAVSIRIASLTTIISPGIFHIKKTLNKINYQGFNSFNCFNLL